MSNYTPAEQNKKAPAAKQAKVNKTNKVAAALVTVSMTMGGLVVTSAPAYATDSLPSANVQSGTTIPAAFSATAGKAQFSASWTAPEVIPTSYKLQYSTSNTFSSSTTTTVTITDTTTVVTGLKDNTTYYVRVGASTASASADYTPFATLKTFGYPATPSSLKAVSGVTQATVTWAAPTNTGGTTVSYVLEYSKDSTFATKTSVDVTDGATSKVITGLDPASQYFFHVKSRNSVGSSLFTSTVSATILTTAGVPTAPVATGKLKSVALTWSAPATTGGSAITGYRVQYSTDSTFATGVQTLDLGNVKTTTITGIDSGTTIYTRIAAINIAGTSNYSTTASAKAFSVPTAVNNAAITAGVNKANITWTAPTSTGGSAITSYRVEYSTNSDFSNLTSRNVGKSLTLALTGLTPDTTYYARVIAISLAGESVATSSVNAKTFALPTAPSATATGSVGQITVNWAAPSANGGSPVTGYRIEYSTNSDFSGSTSVKTLSSATSATITKLPAGTTYYVRVFASTLVGESIATAGTSTITTAVPAALNAPTLTAGFGKFTSTWTAPATESPITGYRVEYSKNADFSASKSVSTTPLVLTSTISSLTAGTTYYVRVYAKSAAGESLAGTTATIKVASAPSAPNALTLTKATNTITGSWTAPTSEGASPVTGYVLQYSTDSTFATGMKSVTSKTLTATIKSLAPNTTYYVRAAAVSLAGQGLYSNVESITTVDQPAVPTALTLTPRGKSLTATWTGSANTTSYTVQVSTTSSFTAATTVSQDFTTSEGTVAGLNPATKYYVRVMASTSEASSAYTSSKNVTTHSAPADVANLSSNYIMDGGVQLNWDSYGTETAPIESFNVKYSTDVTFTYGVTEFNQEWVGARVDSLTPGGTYYMTVQSVNSAGVSSWSQPLEVKAPSVTAAPTNVYAEDYSLLGDQSGYLHIGWTRADEYSAGIWTDSTIVQYSTDSTFATGITELVAPGWAENTYTTVPATGATYYVRVATVNVFGQSDWSEAGTVTTKTTMIAPELTVVASNNTDRQPVLGFTLGSDFSSDSVEGRVYFKAKNVGNPYYGSASYNNRTVQIKNVNSAEWMDAYYYTNWNIVGTEYNDLLANEYIDGISIQNLSANTTYDVRITETNDLGSSVIETQLAVGDFIPNAPQNVMSEKTGPAQMTVTWDASYSLSSTPVTQYNVSLYNYDNVLVSEHIADGTSIVIGNLEGNLYAKVLPIHPSITGTWESLSMPQPYSTNMLYFGADAAAPTNVTATAVATNASTMSYGLYQGGDLTVNWEKGLGGGTVTQYQVSYSTSLDDLNNGYGTTFNVYDATATSTTINYEWWSYLNGQTVYVKVAALNAGQTATSSEVYSFKAAPSAPIMTPVAQSSSYTNAVYVEWQYIGDYDLNPNITNRLQYSEDGVNWKDWTWTYGPTDNYSRSYVSGLQRSTTYYFRVAIIDSGVQSPWSEVYTETTPSGGYPLTPAPTLVANADGTVTASWDIVNGYTTHYVYVSTDGGATWNYNTNVGGTNTAKLYNLDPGTAYMVSIGSYKSGTPMLYGQATSSTITTASVTPTAPTYADGWINGENSAYVYWDTSSSSTAKEWKVEYSTDATFATGVQSITVDRWTSSADITGLSSMTKYYYRIGAVGFGNEATAYSDVHSVVVGWPWSFSWSLNIADNHTSANYYYETYAGATYTVKTTETNAYGETSVSENTFTATATETVTVDKDYVYANTTDFAVEVIAYVEGSQMSSVSYNVPVSRSIIIQDMHLAGVGQTATTGLLFIDVTEGVTYTVIKKLHNAYGWVSGVPETFTATYTGEYSHTVYYGADTYAATMTVIASSGENSATNEYTFYTDSLLQVNVNDYYGYGAMPSFNMVDGVTYEMTMTVWDSNDVATTASKTFTYNMMTSDGWETFMGYPGHGDVAYGKVSVVAKGIYGNNIAVGEGWIASS